MRAFLAALLAFSLFPAAAGDLGKPLILVAKPELHHQLFGSSVLVVAPLGGDQHVGFIVNRPTDATLGKLFPYATFEAEVLDGIIEHGGQENFTTRSSLAPGMSSTPNHPW
jgi:putative AlgH/UPF0301 family transcriptional regulator